MLPLRTGHLPPRIPLPSMNPLPPLASSGSGLPLSHNLTNSNSPPSYLEASQGHRMHGQNIAGVPLLNHYYGGQGRGVAGFRNGTSNSSGSRNMGMGMGMGDISQDLSEEQIHLSALEGVSASQMRTLALQYGVDYRDTGGRTPLMYAVLGNQPKMCEVLIKLKATVNILDLAGVTPLLWATFHARPDIMRILLK